MSRTMSGTAMTHGMLLLDYASFGEYIERINRVVMVVMVVVVDWTDDARVECRGGECVHNVATLSLGIRSKT